MRVLVGCFLIFFCSLSAVPSFEVRRAFVDLTALQNVVETKREDSLGRHLIADLYDCSPEMLEELGVVKKIMLAAAKDAGVKIVAEEFHQFSPVGVTGVLVLAESHLAVHTWPEKGYCAVDLFTCGKTDNLAALEVLKIGFGAKECVAVEINRGMPLIKSAPRSRL